MIEIRITSPLGQFANVQTDSLEKAQKYIQKVGSTKVWGEPDKWVREFDLSEEQIDSLESREVEDEFKRTHTEYKIPAEFTYEFVDLSAQIAAQQQAAQLRSIVTNAMAFGSKLMEDFIVENVQMGITQDGKSEAVLDAMAPVEAALRTGTLYVALERLKTIPQELKDDKYITNERLLVFVNRLEEYLGLELSLSL